MTMMRLHRRPTHQISPSLLLLCNLLILQSCPTSNANDLTGLAIMEEKEQQIVTKPDSSITADDFGDESAPKLSVSSSSLSLSSSSHDSSRIKQETDGTPFCFSGASTVQVRDGQEVPMNRLQLGDWILVQDGDHYEPIYSFGHYSPSAIASFLQFQTTASDSSFMEISPSHMVFTPKNLHAAIPASMIRVGDELLLGTSHNRTATTVTAIRTVTSRGLFAPFTPSGKLVVNGILVSSYIAISGDTQPSPWLLLHHQHWLAHSFQFPHRLACYYFMNSSTRRRRRRQERYTTDGINTWVATPYVLARTVMTLHPIFRNILLAWLALFMWLYNVVEFLLIQTNLYRMIQSL